MISTLLSLSLYLCLYLCLLCQLTIDLSIDYQIVSVDYYIGIATATACELRNAGLSLPHLPATAGLIGPAAALLALAYA